MPKESMRTDLASKICSEVVGKYQMFVVIRERARAPDQHSGPLDHEIRHVSR